MIELDERFEVPATPRAVWQVLSDPHAVVACVPGASLGAERADGSFDASLTVKFGPVRVGFEAQVRLELNDAAMQGQLTAQGKDQQGGTRVHGSMRFTVSEQGSGSLVTLDGQVELTGRLASLIEGGATAVVKNMSREFASELAARCDSLLEGRA